MDPLEVKALYEKYGFLIYGRCIRILCSSDEAQDAFHDIFLKLMRKYPEFKSKEHIIPWIFTVSKNHCFNILRQKKRYVREIEVDELQAAGSLEKDIDTKEIVNSVLRVHGKKVQDAVYYTYVERLTQEEIGVITGQSPATIRRNLKRFKERLPYLQKRLGLS